MIRFKRNLETSKGFMKGGTVTDVFNPKLEEYYIGKGWADNYELPGQKEEKTPIVTKELKTEVVTKKRGRKPKE